MIKKIYVFGFRVHGNPYADKMPVVNCTTIPNPWKRGDNITDDERRAKVKQHRYYKKLVSQGVALFTRYDEIAVGCAFGQHRSRAVAEGIQDQLGMIGEQAEIIYQCSTLNASLKKW